MKFRRTTLLLLSFISGAAAANKGVVYCIPEHPSSSGTIWLAGVMHSLPSADEATAAISQTGRPLVFLEGRQGDNIDCVIQGQAQARLNKAGITCHGSDVYHTAEENLTKMLERLTKMNRFIANFIVRTTRQNAINLLSQLSTQIDSVEALLQSKNLSMPKVAAFAKEMISDLIYFLKNVSNKIKLDSNKIFNAIHNPRSGGLASYFYNLCQILREPLRAAKENSAIAQLADLFYRLMGLKKINSGLGLISSTHAFIDKMKTKLTGASDGNIAHRNNELQQRLVAHGCGNNGINCAATWGGAHFANKKDAHAILNNRPDEKDRTATARLKDAVEAPGPHRELYRFFQSRNIRICTTLHSGDPHADSYSSRPNLSPSLNHNEL